MKHVILNLSSSTPTRARMLGLSDTGTGLQDARGLCLSLLRARAQERETERPLTQGLSVPCEKLFGAARALCPSEEKV